MSNQRNFGDFLLRQNFLEKPDEPSIVRENSINMIQCKVLKNLVNLQQNPREDPDVVDDINYLIEKLQILVRPPAQPSCRVFPAATDLA